MNTTPTASLEAVGAALVEVNAALTRLGAAGPGTHEAESGHVHDALIALARASYDAVAGWEVGAPEEPPQSSTVVERVTRWRAQFDDLRVQAALAEMEVRDTSKDVLAAAERSVSTVEGKLAAAGREITAAVATMRDDLRRIAT